ncbi:hypothetical protein BO70DRAFT_27675 [Aspergillus heteromorphus CBS 117.55]|uniref:Uncharacterized protein n=1 Tax=Aspergillus heteromorphus CBS 117.55 TaxID=1448321 RepID=A0A317WH58_9EURO|nr:uncharacterized protein BO70DRAFT_27675 [Aspergillus heteromorphus CBS 117.55]PWY83530.1 hypothetical protein BO70DRAFT_27675 [Aspergillus heteromorphus CBS 117.55]
MVGGWVAMAMAMAMIMTLAPSLLYCTYFRYTRYQRWWSNDSDGPIFGLQETGRDGNELLLCTVRGQ